MPLDAPVTITVGASACLFALAIWGPSLINHLKRCKSPLGGFSARWSPVARASLSCQQPNDPSSTIDCVLRNGDG
jgi:hypothetical protein